MTDIRFARTWAEIDLDALAHNYRRLRQLSRGGQVKFLGLVKSNAYGHGAVPVARKLQALGADMLAVACLAEAVELRQAGITIPILCLGQTAPEYAPALLEHRITQTVGDPATAQALSDAAVRAGKTLTVHIKLDTGMGRLGLLCTGGGEAALARTAREIDSLCALPGLRAEGLFTHFADADGSEEYTRAQFDRFQAVIGRLRRRGVNFQIYHCAASAAVLNYPWTHLDMIRPGIALYGWPPAPDMGALDLRPVMAVYSRIAALRDMPAGSFVSYGCTARLDRDTRLAVLPIGYGDGYPRSLSNRMEVRIGDKLCPVVGRICMDMCMVDVTGLPQVRPGDTAAVYGPGLTGRAAELDVTIVYELLCRISPRVPRVYLEQGNQIS